MEKKNIINNQPLSDDELVAMFFDENRQELADDGFSHHVMKQLPSRSIRLRRIWTAVCTVVGIAFFFLADGIGQLKLVLFNATGNFVGFLSSIDLSNLPITALLAAILLITAFVTWDWSEKTFRTSPF
jgi:hypothetical protein